MYIPRQSHDEAIDEILALFNSGSVEPELVAVARRLILQEPLKFLRIVIGGTSASETDEISSPSPYAEPSDTCLRLIAALRANDRDSLAIIAQEFTPLN